MDRKIFATFSVVLILPEGLARSLVDDAGVDLSFTPHRRHSAEMETGDFALSFRGDSGVADGKGMLKIVADDTLAFEELMNECSAVFKVGSAIIPSKLIGWEVLDSK